jgi:hypothetical protein
VDRHADRALQCGRRMFLAALILASKYLQDRNYSARAWSKISGLRTEEINQNEIAFLLAVNWKMHIADEVFQRWTDIVLKYTPPPSGPSSPGGVSQTVSQQVLDWKRIILGLNPELTNLALLIPAAPAMPRSSDLCALSPRSILNLPQEAQPTIGYESAEATPTPKSYKTPTVMEPASAGFAAGRVAPSMGKLPTPRFTPQSNGLCTPAASAASHMLSKSSMGMAMAQASNMATVQYLDRLPSSSPQNFCPVRRSSLANSVSTASSPESMISDTSRSSRSSSISSTSTLASATLGPSRLGVPSRFRAQKLCNERLSQKPTVSSVPEDYDAHCYTSSPENCNGPVGKLGDLSLDTPLARRQKELDDMARDSDAARALQELQNYNAPAPRSGTKRSRTASMDNCLQENVREMLGGRYSTQRPTWPDTLVRTRGITSESNLQVPVRPSLPGTGKRVCCSAEAAQGYEFSSVHPALGIRGPGMWEGILN